MWVVRRVGSFRDVVNLDNFANMVVKSGGVVHELWMVPANGTVSVIYKTQDEDEMVVMQEMLLEDIKKNVTMVTTYPIREYYRYDEFIERVRGIKGMDGRMNI